MGPGLGPPSLPFIWLAPNGALHTQLEATLALRKPQKLLLVYFQVQERDFLLLPEAFCEGSVPVAHRRLLRGAAMPRHDGAGVVFFSAHAHKELTSKGVPLSGPGLRYG